MNIIDAWLNRITMYRLVVWALGIYLSIAVVESLIGWLPYSAGSIIGTTAFIVTVGWATHTLFAHVWQAPTNNESWLISALILALIIAPIHSFHDRELIAFVGWATVWTMASKFILSFRRQHLFNPVAVGLVITTLTLHQSVTWWVSTLALLPAVLIGGLLIIRKLRRAELVGSFLAVTLVVSAIDTLLTHGDLLATAQHLVVHSPLVFFATIMLSEPLTLPVTRAEQALYGGLIGLLFSPQFNLGTLYLSPEQALLVGNAASWLVARPERYQLKLVERLAIGPDLYDFVFASNRRLRFLAGQYLDWTLPHAEADGRGNRRSFTIASAPSEELVRFGVKFSDPGSSFKRELLTLEPGDQVSVGPVAGQFCLPRDRSKKVVFLAGGIGITPFRSMVMELLTHRQTRDIVLVYSAKTPDHFVYRDVFDAAARSIGLQPLYVARQLTPDQSADWSGLTGQIDAAFIRHHIPDFSDRTFHLSGSQRTVRGFERTLAELNVPRSQIKTDYFPGL